MSYTTLYHGSVYTICVVVAVQLRSVAVEMGAVLKRRLDQKCTHFVYQVSFAVAFFESL